MIIRQLDYIDTASVCCQLSDLYYKIKFILHRKQHPQAILYNLKFNFKTIC